MYWGVTLSIKIYLSDIMAFYKDEFIIWAVHKITHNKKHLWTQVTSTTYQSDWKTVKKGEEDILKINKVNCKKSKLMLTTS